MTESDLFKQNFSFFHSIIYRLQLRFDQLLSFNPFLFAVSKPVQFSAAYTLLDIASIDPENVSNKLAQWIKQTNTDVPGDLQAKITSMTSKEC